MTKLCTALLGAALVSIAMPAAASNHREAPITALDHKADITDVYAFRSYDGGGDAARDADPGRRSAARAGERTELVPVRPGHPLRDQDRQQQRRRRGHRLPVPLHDRAAAAGLFQVYAGVGQRRDAPANSPAPVAARHADRAAADHRASTSPGSAAAALHGDDDQGRRCDADHQRAGTPFYAVPANVGPRTMDYAALFNAGDLFDQRRRTSRCSRAPPTMRSGSISAAPSTR